MAVEVFKNRLVPIPLLSFEKHRAYSLNEALILFCIESGSLNLLDALSAWVFMLFDNGFGLKEVRQQGIKEKVDAEQLSFAIDSVQEILNLPLTSSGVYRHEYEAVTLSEPIFPGKWEVISKVGLLGKVFQLHSNCPDFVSYLNTLSFSRDAVLNQKADYHFLVSFSKGRYQISCNNIVLASFGDYELLMPALMDYMQIIAYQSSDYLIAVHAAVLEYKGKGLVLPGLSGSGKSTLAVSLIPKGYKCYSDEVAVVSEKHNFAKPLVLPAAIKSGSWKVIGESVQLVSDLPTWRRADGRRSKYIDLPHADESLADIPIAVIVFPKYSEVEESSRLVPLTSIEALKGLTDAGYQIKEGLDEQKVDEILTWITQKPAYQLFYSDLGDAHKVISSLMDS